LPGVFFSQKYQRQSIDSAKIKKEEHRRMIELEIADEIDGIWYDIVNLNAPQTLVE